MFEDVNFSVRDEVISNLNGLSRDYSIISEQRLLELYDIAIPMANASIALMKDGLEGYELISVLSDELRFGDYVLSDRSTKELSPILIKSLTSLARIDRAFLTEIYLCELKKAGYLIDESDFLPVASLPETFTYVRNSFSDEAYDVFSQDFSDPRVEYSKTFKDCARALTSGEVTYCLLPLEEKGGARLHTVSDIIFRNDFKINSVIPVFGSDGNADIKYALVSRSFTVPRKNEDDDLYLEIRLGSDRDGILAEILGVVDYFGMSVYRINTVTFDTEGDPETYVSLVIRDKDTGFAPILTYLTLFVRDFVPVGIYKNLE